MYDHHTADRDEHYDRRRLLDGEKRDSVLELREVQRYGEDSYGDPDYVSIYGLSPGEWYSKGVRLLGRTAVECTRDVLANAIAKDVAALRAKAPDADALVVDLFAGSGNTLYWLLRHLASATGIGFESDPGVFKLTSQNVRFLGLPVEIKNTDYRSGLSAISLTTGQLLIAFIAPPWGAALIETDGLDLRFTTPPITEIVDSLIGAFAHNPILFPIQIHETVTDVSLDEVKSRFDWSMVRIYGLNAAGQNHGILLGAKGWTP